MPKKKGDALSLQDFHQKIEVSGASPPAEDALPRGPSGLSGGDGTATRKWIAEWGGRAEELPTDPSGPSSVAVRNETEFKHALDLSLQEFLSAGDLGEAVRCVAELAAPQFHLHVVKRGVVLAMDKSDREREMVAVLFASLHARGVLSTAQTVAGFRALLDQIGDLTLDCPGAPELLAHYIADAVLDSLVRRAAVDGWRDDAAKAAGDDNPLPAKVLATVDRRLAGRTPLGGPTVAEGQALRKSLRPILDEYLASHDVDEVRRRLSEIALPPNMQHQLVRAAAELGRGRGDAEREWVSQLISQLYGAPVGRVEVAKGFEALLARADDLTLDHPNAAAILAAFTVRAVADDCLPPAFVCTLPPAALCTPKQLEAYTSARAQLTTSHFSDRRRHVWGPGAAASVETLKAEVAELLKEYLLSGEEDEAVRCVRALHAPAFGHELVKRLVALTLDGGASDEALATKLLGRLMGVEKLLSPEQLQLGCQRLVDDVADLRLDNPRAPQLIAAFLTRCCDGLGLDASWRDAAARLGG